MAHEGQSARGTALIIEDNEDNRVLISDLLTQGGYSTLPATTGLDGVAKALQHRPNLVILDIQLPDIDGVEVLRQIRASGANGSLPIIAMTSYAMAGDEQQLIAAGCTGYIEKPIDPTRVLGQIAAILARSGR